MTNTLHSFEVFCIIRSAGSGRITSCLAKVSLHAKEVLKTTLNVPLIPSFAKEVGSLYSE